MKNTMETTIKGLAVAAALILVTFLIVGVYHRTPAVVQACTMEAKICPDGSSVGRTGPNCEFAACPATSTPQVPAQPEAQKQVIQAKIGQKVSALGVSVTPIEVVDDSRCPTDVQCIWAGTVHVRAALDSASGSSATTFELGTPVTTEAESVTLIEVLPAKTAGGAIGPSDYTFTFEVAKSSI